MSSYLDLVQLITVRFHDRILRSCAPLFDCLNLNHFWYYKIRNDGRFAFFDSNIPWCEYYGGEKLYLTHPYLRHPKFHDISNLSSIELNVMNLLLEGYSAAQIALRLFRSSRTVEHHIERIKEKLGCCSKGELIQKARKMERFNCFKQLNLPDVIRFQ